MSLSSEAQVQNSAAAGGFGTGVDVGEHLNGHSPTARHSARCNEHGSGWSVTQSAASPAGPVQPVGSGRTWAAQEVEREEGLVCQKSRAGSRGEED